MPLKVLVISNYNDPIVTRPEAEIILGLKQAGLDIEVITDANTEYGQKFMSSGIKVYDRLISKKYDRSEITFIKEILSEGKHHILQLFNGTAIVNGIQAAKGLSVKVVLYRGFSGHINWWDPAAYTKFLHPRVDKIICNSVGVKEIFDRQLFFDKTKAVAINKGHKPEWYADVKPIDREDLGLKKDSLAVACVANNRPMKGVKYLMQAMAKLPVEANIQLVMIGKDLDNKEALSILENSPNRDKVIFIGYRKDALQVEAACDVFALASIKGESITKAAIEAMSLGLAPVISDIAGNRELVMHEKNGLVFPSKNAEVLASYLLRLEADRELVKKFGAASREHIKLNLSNAIAVKKYKAVYEELTA